jgi:antitoxin (DNA-binding transcriptional repressor) of toxin-antitoxin stability system
LDATILDLRYRMASVLEALERREEVRVLYHGKPKGTIIPEGGSVSSSVKAHPFFGSHKDANESVTEAMARLRGGRFRDL